MFGDQNLFCRKSDFVRQGGYDETLPIMEDLDLLMRLHYAGPSPQHSIDVQAGQGEHILKSPAISCNRKDEKSCTLAATLSSASDA